LQFYFLFKKRKKEKDFFCACFLTSVIKNIKELWESNQEKWWIYEKMHFGCGGEINDDCVPHLTLSVPRAVHGKPNEMDDPRQAQ
jgi:hypothetical protein